MGAGARAASMVGGDITVESVGAAGGGVGAGGSGGWWESGPSKSINSGATSIGRAMMNTKLLTTASQVKKVSLIDLVFGLVARFVLTRLLRLWSMASQVKKVGFVIVGDVGVGGIGVTQYMYSDIEPSQKGVTAVVVVVVVVRVVGN